MKLIDLLIERQRRQEKYFKNYPFYAKKIKKVAEELLGKTKVLVFGSILKKDELPRDIDILVISPKLRTSKKKSEIRVEFWQRLGTSFPFEIHLITPKDYQNWYKFFIKEKLEI